MNCKGCGKDLSGQPVKQVNTKYGMKDVIECPFCKDGRFPTTNWLPSKKETPAPVKPKNNEVSSGDVQLGILRDILTNTKILITQMDDMFKSGKTKDNGWGEEN